MRACKHPSRPAATSGCTWRWPPSRAGACWARCCQVSGCVGFRCPHSAAHIHGMWQAHSSKPFRSCSLSCLALAARLAHLRPPEPAGCRQARSGGGQPPEEREAACRQPQPPPALRCHGLLAVLLLPGRRAARPPMEQILAPRLRMVVRLPNNQSHLAGSNLLHHRARCCLACVCACSI